MKGYSKSPKPAIPEAAIEQAILTWLMYSGIFAWKNITGGYFSPKLKRHVRQRSKFALNGVSDIVGIVRGRALFIEVKAAKGKVSPEQKEFIERANKAGALAFVARSVEDVERELLPHLNAI